jgi:hypothetical protein
MNTGKIRQYANEVIRKGYPYVHNDEIDISLVAREVTEHFDRHDVFGDNEKNIIRSVVQTIHEEWTR